MQPRKWIVWPMILALALFVVPTALQASSHDAAQEEGASTPTVEVSDQPIVDGTVTVDRVVAAQDGWMVIHAQKDGRVGPPIGSAAVMAGENAGIVVTVDVEMATETLYAMLHVDAGEPGTYEFPGPDGPVMVEDKPLVVPFMVTGQMTRTELLQQQVADLEAQVAALEAAWVQASTYQVANTLFLAAVGDLDDGAAVAQLRRVLLATHWPDEALASQAQELADTLNRLAKALASDEDTADLRSAAAEGRDALVAAGNRWLDRALGILEPAVEVSDQPIVDGTVTVDQVVAAQDGWIVVHTQKDGGIGPVIGYAPVSAGTNTNVAVEIDPEAASNTLYAMLHVDAGEPGTYEFPGPDGPVVLDGKPLAPAFQVLPSPEEEAMEEAEEEVVIDIRRFSFGAPLQIQPGTTVIWINQDAAPHTVTASDGTFDSGNLSQGAEFRYTFTEPGEYEYYCRYHPGMVSTIIVTGE